MIPPCEQYYSAGLKGIARPNVARVSQAHRRALTLRGHVSSPVEDIAMRRAEPPDSFAD